MERKYEQERDAITDKYNKLSDEAYARLEDTFQVKELDDGTTGMVNGGDFKTKDGKGRTPACEVMIANTAIRNLIREDRIYQIPSIIQSGGVDGMQSLDQDL